MNSTALQKIAEWLVRLALSSAFLSAVADRFGWWGASGAPNVAWGNWRNFQIYSSKLSGFLPTSLQTAAAILATIAEIVLGIGLLLPFATKWIAFASGVLLSLFAAAMIVALGVKAPLNYSVFTAAAAAFLLATLKSGNRSK